MTITSKEEAQTRIDHSVLCSSQNHLRTGTRDLDHPVHIGAKNIGSWRVKKGDLQRTFPLDVPMVPSPKLFFLANSSNPTDVGLALSKTIHFNSLEFTADHLGHISLSPKERDSGTLFIGMVHNRSLSLHTALGDSSDEYDTASGAVGSSRSPRP
jgi:hypothetical protein